MYQMSRYYLIINKIKIDKQVFIMKNNRIDKIK